MRLRLVPAGRSGGAGDLVDAITGLDGQADAVWFAGRPGECDETAVAAAALAATTTVRIGVPVSTRDHVLWAARRLGTLAWVSGGRLDVVFVVARPADEPTALAGLVLLRQLWSDPGFAERVQLRPAGDASVRAVVLGPHADAIAAPLGLGWAVPGPTDIRCGGPAGRPGGGVGTGTGDKGTDEGEARWLTD